MLRLNPCVTAVFAPAALTDDWIANGPIDEYEPTPAANPCHTGLGIVAGLQPKTNLHHI
jgi:hypothetical protein